MSNDRRRLPPHQSSKSLHLLVTACHQKMQKQSGTLTYVLRSGFRIRGRVGNVRRLTGEYMLRQCPRMRALACTRGTYSELSAVLAGVSIVKLAKRISL